MSPLCILYIFHSVYLQFEFVPGSPELYRDTLMNSSATSLLYHPTMRSVYMTGFSPRVILQAFIPQQDLCTSCLVIWSSPELTNFPLFLFSGKRSFCLSPTAQNFLPTTRDFPVWEGSFNQLLQLISFFEIHLPEAASISRKKIFKLLNK